MIYTEPKNIDEYLDIADQAIFGPEELLMCAEDEDGQDFQLMEMAHIYEYLAKVLKKLHQDNKQGRQQFVNGRDLPYMGTVKQARPVIPFVDLLDLSNDVHRNGIEN